MFDSGMIFKGEIRCWSHLRSSRVNWLIVLSFEGSGDPSVNDIVTKVNMKLTMARSLSGKKYYAIILYYFVIEY